jgi:hypothetical protein
MYGRALGFMMPAEIVLSSARYKFCTTGLTGISINGISLAMIMPGK